MNENNYQKSRYLYDPSGPLHIIYEWIFDSSGSRNKMWRRVYDPIIPRIQILGIRSRDPFMGSAHMSGQGDDI